MRNSFRRPTPLGGVEHYDYKEDNVVYFALSLWNRYVLENENDFVLAVEGAINQIVVERGNGIVRFDQLLIREGNDNELELIENAMKGNLRNRRILPAILSLRGNAHDLQDIADHIAEGSEVVSSTIDNGTYRTKAKCCPTLLRMLEDYIF